MQSFRWCSFSYMKMRLFFRFILHDWFNILPMYRSCFCCVSLHSILPIFCQHRLLPYILIRSSYLKWKRVTKTHGIVEFEYENPMLQLHIWSNQMSSNICRISRLSNIFRTAFSCELTAKFKQMAIKLYRRSCVLPFPSQHRLYDAEAGVESAAAWRNSANIHANRHRMPWTGHVSPQFN